MLCIVRTASRSLLTNIILIPCLKQRCVPSSDWCIVPRAPITIRWQCYVYLRHSIAPDTRSILSINSRSGSEVCWQLKYCYYFSRFCMYSSFTDFTWFYTWTAKISDSTFLIDLILLQRLIYLLIFFNIFIYIINSAPWLLFSVHVDVLGCRRALREWRSIRNKHS